MEHLTNSFHALLNSFQSIFTQPSLQIFLTLMTGWITSVRHRFVTELIYGGDQVGVGHWSRFHRFFSHYVWSLDDLCLVLTRLLLAVFVPQGPILLALDADAVLFSDASERIYQERGLDAFLDHEKANARQPLPEGPFAKLLRTLSKLQADAVGRRPVRIAVVSARNMPAHERVIRTLLAWNVHVDEAFFMGGVSKTKILEAFHPHIFFDDQDVHCRPASAVVPTGRVL